MPLVERWADWWNCPTYAIDRFDELRQHAGSARVSVQHPIGLAASSSERDEVVRVAERRFGGWGGLVAGTPDVMKAAFTKETDFFETRGIKYVDPAMTFTEPTLLKRQLFEAWGELLCTASGLPPVPEGVATMPSRRGQRGRA